MTLSYNKKDGSFFVLSNEKDKPRAAGLTLSRKARGPDGERVWYTAGYNKQPVDNPYPVFDFYNDADDKAKEKLAPLLGAYDSSFADKPSPGFTVPSPEGREFLPFQLAGIEYALKRGNTLIGDEPGLGKTIQAIGFANALDAQNVLVLVPASIRLNWQREIKAWSTLDRVSTYPILKASDGVNPQANYVIVSYNLATNRDIHNVHRN